MDSISSKKYFFGEIRPLNYSLIYYPVNYHSQREDQKTSSNMVIRAIQRKLKWRWFARIKHVYCEANGVADSLATFVKMRVIRMLTELE
ncbi:hypothetical protein PVK06_004193 [Gossypium arboreum]|uniref:RNase H type-1 domain-containing protein n=1 Tax=Gossypium arboreum TaxID=29729 RepID=A0ABR0QRB2_GOSAR|nr:hypothetical protein PVK06_004193 [Gossypium arboreum]